MLPLGEPEFATTQKLASNGSDVHLAAPSSFKKELSCSVRTACQCAHSICTLTPTVIERGCSIGANCAQNCQLTSSDSKKRAVIARFRIVRARFNKRSTRAFPKADHRSKICDAPRANSISSKSVSLLTGRPPCLTETYHDDAFALDDYGRLLWAWHLPHRRHLALQRREAHGHGARSRETRLACDRGFFDGLRPRRGMRTCFRPTIPRSADGGLHFSR
jgi:hypothetical protein